MSSTTSDDEITLSIAGEKFTHWADLEIAMSMDSFANVGFETPFVPEQADFRKRFQPFSFLPIDVTVGDETLFRGTLHDVKPSLTAEKRVAQVSAYALACALEFTEPTVGMLPIEANGLTLRQIAQQIAKPFGFGVTLAGEEGAAFRKVKTRRKTINTRADMAEKLHGFLLELAKQRGKLITNTRTGDLAFIEPTAMGKPVARFVEGEQPLMAVEVEFDPRNYYNEITGFTTGKHQREAAKWTERLERNAGGALRALNLKLDDVEKGDAPKAVKAAVGRMIAGLASYVVHAPTWRDPSGELWEPNTTVTLHAPSAMVYQPYELLVKDVVFKRSASERTASLGLVLPGSFSGTPPSSFPWEE